MFQFLGSVITFFFSFIAFFLLGIVVMAITLFGVMRYKVYKFRKKMKENAGQRTDEPPTWTRNSGSKDAGAVSSDFEQPVYDDSDAEYVDYEEVE